MPALSLRLGHDLADLDGRRHDAALFPVPRWQPTSGFQVEPALVYALMRQESGFNPKATSRAGASGLMQLMPATAAVMDDTRKKLPAEKLLDPVTNMELGQRYIRHLLEQDVVQGDLIRLAAAYNGGPGNLSRWQRAGEAQADALLYIEALPAAETRQFITRVLVNYWMYAERLGQAAPSLDAIARGEWPAYGGDTGDLDSPAMRHARN
jgi:soluble lytic murein transglycosylase-like protein